MNNNVPKNWEKVKLKKYIEIIRGVNYKSNEAYDYKDDNTIGILRANNISNNGTLNFEKIIYVDNKNIKNEQIIKKGDIIIAMSSGSKDLVGKAAQARQDLNFAFGAFCGVVRPKNINSDFLGFYFLTDYYRNKISELSTGININNLRKEYIENLDIMVPLNPKEQEEIVLVLGAMSDIIRLREKCISHAQDLIPALFREMFDNPQTNKKNWQICRLRDLAKIDRQNISPEKLKTKRYTYIGLEHIEKETGRILVDPNVQLDIDLKSNKFFFTSNHVLYGKLRPYLNKVALPDFDGVCSTDIFPLLPLEGISNKYFLKVLMSTSYFVNMANSQSSGANLPRIGTTALENIKVFKPNYTLQEQFAEKVREINSYIEEQQEELENAKQMFQSLLYHAFTGELTRRAYGEN